MKKILDMKKMGALALGLMAFAPLILLISRLPLRSSWVVATGRQALVPYRLPLPSMVMPTVLPLPT